MPLKAKAQAAASSGSVVNNLKVTPLGQGGGGAPCFLPGICR